MQKEPVILIAGANGFVGRRAMDRFPGAVAIPRELLRAPEVGLDRWIRSQEPDWILNAAAISDIGACEKDPEGSRRANVELPLVMAEAAAQLGAKFLSFSSDQVYTGCTGPGPYRETEKLPEPANIYARHKLEAERRILELDPNAVLLRATWMYDMPAFGHANRGNFLVNTVDAVLRHRPVRVSGTQFRGITYVRQVADLLDRVARLPGGVYNYGSENPLNMVQTAHALLEALDLAGEVEDTRENRHNLWMDCSRIRAHGICFDTTARGFVHCAEDYGLTR